MFIQLKTLNSHGFEKYGRILTFDSTLQDDFQINVTENEGVGWRIAVMRVAHKHFSKMACHPNTMEAFEPLTGVCVLVVAPPGKPTELEAFLLDQPVCIHKSTWHFMLSLSETAIVKVTENATVETETFELAGEFSFGLTGLHRGESLCQA